MQKLVATYLEIKKESLPLLMLIDTNKAFTKYRYEDDISTINTLSIGEFIQNWKDGKLMPSFKSQEEPENEKHGNVTIIVGNSWDRIVNDATKDVLVLFYAPWCAHCQKLQPVWSELSDFVDEIDDLIIAKIDATENEVPGFKIEKYPTIKFFPKNRNK